MAATAKPEVATLADDTSTHTRRHSAGFWKKMEVCWRTVRFRGIGVRGPQRYLRACTNARCCRAGLETHLVESRLVDMLNYLWKSARQLLTRGVSGAYARVFKKEKAQENIWVQKFGTPTETSLSMSAFDLDCTCGRDHVGFRQGRTTDNSFRPHIFGSSLGRQTSGPSS